MTAPVPEALSIVSSINSAEGREKEVLGGRRGRGCVHKLAGLWRNCTRAAWLPFRSFSMGIKQRADRVVSARWVATVGEDEKEVLEHASVALRDGCIVAVDSTEVIEASFDSEIWEQYSEHILTPGLVNAHTHSSKWAGRFLLLGWVSFSCKWRSVCDCWCDFCRYDADAG